MDELSTDEMAAFLDIYDADHEGSAPTPAVIDSLVRRGLIGRAHNGAVSPTKAGNELYETLQGDEPYEGI